MDSHWQPRSLIGRKINGRYELVEPFACGGMGVVFRAVDLASGKPLAVKVLHPRNALEPEMIRRFCAEADALRGLDHPCVVRIIESGVEPGLSPWIAMELVEGEDLARRLQRSHSRGVPALRTQDVLTIGIDIADALVAVHAMGRVHRDVKPSNIVTNSITGRSKLVDFGISKRLAGNREDVESITRPGAFVGTEDYAAPEQNEGEARAASDVYALALTLSEALGGGPRRDADGKYRGWPNVMRPLIGRGEPDRLVDLLSKALDDRPEQRPAAAVFRDELKEILGEWGANVRGAGRPRRSAVDRAAETRAPIFDAADRETRVPRVQALGRPSSEMPSRRMAPRTSKALVAGFLSVVIVAIAAAVLALGVDPGSWLRESGFGGASADSSTAPAPAPAPAMIADARPSPAPSRAWSRDEKYARIVQTHAAIGALGAAFERDVKGSVFGRESRLRYDCSRMRRLSYDVDGIDHPLADEGRGRLAALASAYEKRCERVRSGATAREGRDR